MLKRFWIIAAVATAVLLLPVTVTADGGRAGSRDRKKDTRRKSDREKDTKRRADETEEQRLQTAARVVARGVRGVITNRPREMKDRFTSGRLKRPGSA